MMVNPNVYLYIKLISIIVSLSNNDLPENKKRTTKKGLIITIMILAGIVAASFLVYLIP
jgi:hypothetical protein